MNREFLNEAINLFDTSEKWNSFLELFYQKDKIVMGEWFNKAKISVNNHFINDLAEGWTFKNWNTWDYKWFLKDFGENSLCIWMYGNRIGLWLNGNLFDSDKANSLLNTEKYSRLLSFLRPDEISPYDWKIIETGNFVFNSVNDGHISSDELAWYAGNQTEELVKQIAEKINRIRKNPELTQLLRELNEKCKRE